MAIETVIVEIPAPIVTVEVQIPGKRGLRGEIGNPGIVVSEDEPLDPEENMLWLQIEE